MLPIRQREDKILSQLAARLPIKIPDAKYNDPHVKANLLLQVCVCVCVFLCVCLCVCLCLFVWLVVCLFACVRAQSVCMRIFTQGPLCFIGIRRLCAD